MILNNIVPHWFRNDFGRLTGATYKLSGDNMELSVRVTLISPHQRVTIFAILDRHTTERRIGIRVNGNLVAEGRTRTNGVTASLRHLTLRLPPIHTLLKEAVEVWDLTANRICDLVAAEGREGTVRMEDVVRRIDAMSAIATLA